MRSSDLDRTFELDGITYTVTRHAIERMLDMGVDERQVRAALTNPSQIVPHNHVPGGYYLHHGRIQVVVRPHHRIPGSHAITTVMWRNKKGWADDLARGEYGGRHAS